MSYGLKIWYNRAVEVLGNKPFVLRELPDELREHDYRVVAGYIRQLHMSGKVERLKRTCETQRHSVWMWRLRTWFVNVLAALMSMLNYHALQASPDGCVGTVQKNLC